MCRSVSILLLALFLDGGPAAAEAPLVAPGREVEQELAGGGARAFRLEALPGHPLLVTAEQHGINVALSLEDPCGNALGQVDTATERERSETWLLEAGEGGGTYRVGVASLVKEVPPGRFRLRVEELPAEAPADRQRIEAERRMTVAGLLLSRGTGESLDRALAFYGEALALWRTLGRKPEEARTLFAMAQASFNLGQAAPALDRLREALPLFSDLGDEAGETDTLTLTGLAEARLGHYAEARALFERSLEIRRRRGDAYGEAVTFHDVCFILHLEGEVREAIPCYEKALGLLEAIREPDIIALALGNLGGAHRLLGEPREALDYYTRARERQHALGNRRDEALVLNNLAELYTELGRFDEAQMAYDEALGIYRDAGDRFREAQALNNLGDLYLSMGEPRRALGYFEQALPLRRAAKDPRGEVTTLDNLGHVQEQLGDVTKALELYGQGLALAREAGEKAGEAASLNHLAEGHRAAGDPGKALGLYAQAADLQRTLGSRGGLALALERSGEIRTGIPDPAARAKARADLQEALELRRALEDRAGQAEALTALADLDRAEDRLGDALGHVEEALGLIESVRAAMAAPDLRAAFLASQRRAFDLALQVRMALDLREPGRGHAEAALALAERARSRSLLDLLHESRTEIRQGVAPALREKETGLAFRLAENARRRRALGPKAPEENQAKLRRELADLLNESDLLAAEIRRSNPHYAALTQPQPLDAAGIRGLLDAGTLLLEYALTDGGSYLWAVSAGRVEGFALRGRAEIEAAARRVYDSLKMPGQPGAAAARQELGGLLLGKVAGRLAGKRLVVVADGALQYIPFAVLPDPGDPAGAPLIAEHEIVNLPSASVLDVQRRLLAGRAPAPRTAAVLADPVFQLSDSRFRRQGPAAAPGGVSRSSLSDDALHLARLPATRREAEAIAALLPADQVFLALDFDASRETALSPALAGFRIVHFATHGLIDSETPRQSALALSMVDREGRREVGLVGLSDVYNLELDADLVVLSGCETALGKEIRGEGLVGLTQGFLHAGAERVVASLWRVEDRATSELMGRFYAAMLKEKLPPAAALRQAQLSVRGDPRWQDPFYWAPFVLQGDWR